MQKCTVDGHEIAYVREGLGDTVLFVHGITTYSFIWQKIVPLLSPHYDVIALDLLGCGESDMPPGVDYSIKRQAGLIKNFIANMGLDRVHLVAHDIGGGIAQIIAVEHPELFYDISLINTVGYDYWPVQPILTMRTPIIRQLAMAALDFGMFKLIVRKGLYHKENLTEQLMEQFWAPMKTKEGRKAFLHLAHCLDNKHLMEIQDKQKELTLPVLIIRGEGDVYLTGEIALRLHKEIPDTRFISIKTGGHFIMEDEPVLIADALKGFFK